MSLYRVWKLENQGLTEPPYSCTPKIRMVFANLTDEDKEAFFALLDEYFSSRPELADALQLGTTPRANSSSSSSNNDNPTSSGVTAARRVLASNPEATSAAVSAGLRSVSGKSSHKSSQFANAASNPELSNAVGRFAAASLAFNGGNPPRPPVPSAKGTSADLRPPPPPRRSTSNSSLNTSASDAPPPPRAKPATPSALVSQRKLGDIDTSSGKNMLWGLRNKEASPAAPVPSAALAASKPKPLAPPPRRGTVPVPRARTPTPEPEPEPEEEEEAEYEGEWAEALYDYKSTDPNDLSLRADQRVLVTARTSDDWWTGEVDGKSGLFPASYVKLL